MYLIKSVTGFSGFVTYEHMHGLLSSHNLTFSQKLSLKFLCKTCLVGFWSSLCQSAERRTWYNLVLKSCYNPKEHMKDFNLPHWLDGTDLEDNKQEQQQTLLCMPISTSTLLELPYYLLVPSQMYLFAEMRWNQNLKVDKLEIKQWFTLLSASRSSSLPM